MRSQPNWSAGRSTTRSGLLLAGSQLAPILVGVLTLCSSARMARCGAAEASLPDAARKGTPPTEAAVSSRAPGTLVVKSVRPRDTTSAEASYGLTREDLRRIQSLVSGGAVPLRVAIRDAVYGHRTARVRAIGTTARLAKMEGLKLARGRFLTTTDEARLNNVAVLSHAVARRLFDSADALGKNVRIGDGTDVGPRVLIERDTTVGEDCRLFNGAVLGTDPQDLK